MEWKDHRGREINRVVNLSIPDIQTFKDTAGYAHLLIAANPHLSISELLDWLKLQGDTQQRTRTFVMKRRWMYHPEFKPGARENRDGKDDRARALMAHPDYRKLSLRDMGKVLAEHGCKRSREWIRLNRVAGRDN